MIRTGIGWDIHKLKRGRRFLLCGVEIPFNKGEDGHSDGDVLAHAICDALLGACALGDIGELFPPDDPVFKDADSMKLLRNAALRVKQQGWQIVNIDCVIVCDKPKVLPFREVIRKSIAENLEIPFECVFLKGKTSEGLVRGKAVEAFTVCLLEKNE